jgi:hypothetical protein
MAREQLIGKTKQYKTSISCQQRDRRYSNKYILSFYLLVTRKSFPQEA